MGDAKKAKPNGKPQPRRERRNNKRSKIDVSAVLNEPVTVTKDGTARKMPPFEVALRAQVKKALTERNLAAIRNILALCVQHGRIEPPPAPPVSSGGVLEIPKTFSEDEQRAVFDSPEPSMNLLEKALRISHAKRR
jgi:hypothetical protein